MPGLNLACRISSVEGGMLSSGVGMRRRRCLSSASVVSLCLFRARRVRVSSATDGVEDGSECGGQALPGGQARRNSTSRLSLGDPPFPGKRTLLQTAQNLHPATAAITGMNSWGYERLSWAR